MAFVACCLQKCVYTYKYSLFNVHRARAFKRRRDFIQTKVYLVSMRYPLYCILPSPSPLLCVHVVHRLMNFRGNVHKMKLPPSSSPRPRERSLNLAIVCCNPTVKEGQKREGRRGGGEIFRPGDFFRPRRIFCAQFPPNPMIVICLNFGQKVRLPVGDGIFFFYSRALLRRLKRSRVIL